NKPDLEVGPFSIARQKAADHVGFETWDQQATVTGLDLVQALPLWRTGSFGRQDYNVTRWYGTQAVSGVLAMRPPSDPQGHISGWSGGRYFLFGSMCLCVLLAWGTKARQVVLRVASTGLLC